MKRFRNFEIPVSQPQSNSQHQSALAPLRQKVERAALHQAKQVELLCKLVKIVSKTHRNTQDLNRRCLTIRHAENVAALNRHADQRRNVRGEDVQERNQEGLIESILKK